MYDLAVSILTECKQAAQLSDLNTAIWFLREALTLRPAPHPHRPDSLNKLAETLVVRFWHDGQLQDLCEAISLAGKALGLLEDDLAPVTSTSNESQLSVCCNA